MTKRKSRRISKSKAIQNALGQLGWRLVEYRGIRGECLNEWWSLATRLGRFQPGVVVPLHQQVWRPQITAFLALTGNGKQSTMIAWLMQAVRELVMKCGERIRDLREAKNLNQRELGDMVGDGLT